MCLNKCNEWLKYSTFCLLKINRSSKRFATFVVSKRCSERKVHYCAVMISVKSLRNYFLQQPLIDWLDRYGAQWLHRDSTPDHFRELPTDAKVRAGMPLINDSQSAYKIDEGPTPSCRSAFYKWIIAECARLQLRAPTVHDYEQVLAYSLSTALSSVHSGSHTVYENPILLSRSDGMHVSPVALISGCLAARLFGSLRPDSHKDTPFSSWVAVFKPSASCKTSCVVSTTSVKAQFDALQCHIAQRALDDTNLNDEQWGGSQHAPFLFQCITCILFDPKSPEKMYIWLHTCKAISKKYQAAREWQKSVRCAENASQWDPLKPGDQLELCAPLGNKIPERWRAICNALLQATDDMGLIYKLGANSRAQAWEMGARTYHDLWSMQKTLKPLKLNPLTLAMSWANHRDNPENTVTPRRLTNTRHKALVQRTQIKPWFVVDFETLEVKKELWLFMVATVFVDPTTTPPTKKVFTHRMESLTTDAQVTMLVSWVQDMRTCLIPTTFMTQSSPTHITDIPLTDTPILHWSSAEPSFLKRLFQKSHDVREMLQLRCKATYSLLSTQATNQMSGGLCWCDIYTVFRNEPITISGCFNFKLKHVVKALVAIGKLSDDYIWAVEGPQDGLAAMQRAEYGYASGDTSVFKEIVKYNEADVLVLYSMMVEVLWHMNT